MRGGRRRGAPSPGLPPAPALPFLAPPRSLQRRESRPFPPRPAPPRTLAPPRWSARRGRPALAGAEGGLFPPHPPPTPPHPCPCPPLLPAGSRAASSCRFLALPQPPPPRPAQAAQPAAAAGQKAAPRSGLRRRRQLQRPKYIMSIIYHDYMQVVGSGPGGPPLLRPTSLARSLMHPRALAPLPHRAFAGLAPVAGGGGGGEGWGGVTASTWKQAAAAPGLDGGGDGAAGPRQDPRLWKEGRAGAGRLGSRRLSRTVAGGGGGRDGVYSGGIEAGGGGGDEGGGGGGDSDGIPANVPVPDGPGPALTAELSAGAERRALLRPALPRPEVRRRCAFSGG